jgi:hypothetical protein
VGIPKKYHWYSFVWKSYSYLGVAPLKNGNIAGIKWYSNAHLLYQGCLKVHHQLIGLQIDGNGYNRTAMMMSYDAGAGWWTL